MQGAVANGRAKFESQKISPEKPLRFFGSRSRPATPLLPVKAPKVPFSHPLFVLFSPTFFPGYFLLLPTLCVQVPAPVDPSGGSPGPVKKKANSTGVSPDQDDDSPTLEQIELVGIMERQLNLN